MRILQIIDSLRVGGAQKLIIVFAEEMLKRNHQVEVASLDNQIWDTSIFEELKRMGIPVKRFPLKNLGDLATMVNLTHFVKSSKPDIVHTQLNYANIIGTLVARKSGIPSVASLHNATLYTSNWYRFRIWLETMILSRFSRRVIACGYTVASVQQPRFKTKKLIVISNPVPGLQHVKNSIAKDFRISLLSDDKGILLVSVGRLIFEKGYPDLIEAINQVSKQTNQEFKLLIVGSGPLLEQLLRTVMDRGLGNHIQFLGQRDDVTTILAASDIYISSSHFEGQSIAVLEAMAAGLPVIATDVGDNAQVISPECGILVPVAHPEMIAAQTLRLMNNPVERARFANRTAQIVKKNLSPSLWAEKLLLLYDEVLGE
jgi:glycosyltransferase involved in cell wall biosynthesis